MDDLALVEAAAANNVAAFDMIARHATWPGAGAVRRFGGVVAVVTGHPTAGFWNPVLAVAPRAQIVDTLAAASWVRGHGVPCSVHLDVERGEVGIEGAVSALRLARDPTREPVMALTRIPKPPAAPSGLRVEHVAGADGLREWLRTLVDSDEAVQRAGHTIGDSILGDRDVRLLAGRVDGRVVSTSMAVRSDRTVGIYMVGTVEAYRRRGLGTAMTWAAVDAGRRWGCRTAILQASSMGHPLYRSMGFRTIAQYTQYMETR